MTVSSKSEWKSPPCLRASVVNLACGGGTEPRRHGGRFVLYVNSVFIKKKT